MISKLRKGDKFHTIKQAKEFEAYYHNEKVYIIPESGKMRFTKRSTIEKVWNSEARILKSERFKPRTYLGISMNASYILALMKHFLKDEEIEI